MKDPRRMFAAGMILFSAAVILQYYLILTHRTESVLETTFRFFTFFTILTNSLCAVYFVVRLFFPQSSPARWFEKYSSVTALCVYITIVGLVYQVVLRPLWQPEGLQRVVDELLHTVNPAFFILYWFFCVGKRKISLQAALPWMIYPLAYFGIILLRGMFAQWYPYPFVNVTELGYTKVFLNAGIMTGVFFVMSVAFIFIGTLRTASHKTNGKSTIS